MPRASATIQLFGLTAKFEKTPGDGHGAAADARRSTTPRSSAGSGYGEAELAALKQKASISLTRPSSRQEELAMGMTVVEKILARACGHAVGRRPATSSSRAVDLAMSHENARAGDQPVQGDLPGHGPRAEASGTRRRIAIIFDHRVPAESPKTATNQKKIREFVAPARHHQVPRHPRRRGRHLPPDPARERLRAAGLRRGRHRQPHHQPRRAGRLRLRHRRHRDGRGLGARAALNVEVPADHQGRGQRQVPASTSGRRT